MAATRKNASPANNSYWLNCFSDRRYGLTVNPAGPRTEYERDFDRIIFSSAFRRLQNKTQVFPCPNTFLCITGSRTRWRWPV